MNCSKIGHSYEAFKYLFERNILLRLLSANKNSPVYVLKLVGLITGNFGLIQDFTNKFVERFGKNEISFSQQESQIFPKLSRNLAVESRINPKFPMIAKIYTGEFLFSEKR